MSSTLGAVAELVRSKNAGPFWLTIDVFCGGANAYESIVASAVTDRDHIARTFHVATDTVRIFMLPALSAIKISLPRPTVQGSIRDTDLHAGQQYVALLGTPVWVA